MGIWMALYSRGVNFDVDATVTLIFPGQFTHAHVALWSPWLERSWHRQIICQEAGCM